MNKKNSIKEFNHTLENDALLDIFSTAGVTEEISQDSFEVSSSSNLTILILACGQGGGSIGEIVSSMASEKALELLESYRYNQKTSEEILAFLKSIFPLINQYILDYLHSANIQGYSTSLSVALIYKNSFYMAHIGQSRIYLIRRNETPTLLSFGPSYNKKFSKKSLQSPKRDYFLGDEAFLEDNTLVSYEGDLLHKERLFLCNKSILDSIPEIKLDNNIAEIEVLLESQPPLTSAIFLRYLHYERSIEKMTITKDDIEEEFEESEIDWERLIPLLKKIALVLGVLLSIGFFYLVWSQSESDVVEETQVEKSDKKSLTKNIISREMIEGENLPLKNEEHSNEKKENHIEEKPEEAVVPPKKDQSLIKSRDEVVVEKEVEPTIAEKELEETNEDSTPTDKDVLKEHLSGQKLELLQKKDSTILHIGEDGMRITFKENRLVASQNDFFQEDEEDDSLLYGTIKGATSDLTGAITSDLRKQLFCEKVTLKRKGNDVKLSVRVRGGCHYTRSAWAKSNGLDLLIFECEE